MCEDPATQMAGSTVTVVGYENPALEGHMVNFSCSHEQVSYTLICMRNGEWEPNPKEMCDITMITRPITPSDSPLFQSTGTYSSGELISISLAIYHSNNYSGFAT